MIYLRKVLWGLALIVLTILLVVLLDRLFPDASPFNHNLLVVLQFVILLCTILNLLSQSVLSWKMIRKNLLILFLILALPELLFTYLLKQPSKIPGCMAPVFRQYYDGLQRNVIQFNPDYGVYDSNFFYTLKPSSTFIFSNIEFSDSFYTNACGLRDDEGSLSRPGIICLGDSYAMGWGVAQSETFAEQLSSRSGKKVLNAAMSSYGTARELKTLYRLDTANLQSIIIQYCRNDDIENKQYADDGNHLKISPVKDYRSAVNTHYWSKYWFPGKHFITMAKMYASNKLAAIRQKENKQSIDSSAFYLHQSARYFTDMLLQSAINFKKTKLYVVDLNHKELMNNDFLNEVKMLAEQPACKSHFNGNLILVPVADLLGNEDFYTLDMHIRASGHRKIAERLNSYMFPEK